MEPHQYGRHLLGVPATGLQTITKPPPLLHQPVNSGHAKGATQLLQLRVQLALRGPRGALRALQSVWQPANRATQLGCEEVWGSQRQCGRCRGPVPFAAPTQTDRLCCAPAATPGGRSSGITSPACIPRTPVTATGGLRTMQGARSRAGHGWADCSLEAGSLTFTSVALWPGRIGSLAVRQFEHQTVERAALRLNTALRN